MLTAEQLEARRQGIGGSDAGAVLGLNPYRSPLTVYQEKVGVEEPPDLGDVDAVRWGNLLEDTLAREYATRTGCRVRRRNQTFVHPDLPFIVGHVDRTIDGQRKVLEIKTAGPWMAKDWGPDGSDQVPDSYLVQCLHYMLTTGYRDADLCVLIGGQDFRIYHIPFDQFLADMIVERESRFWTEHVLARVPPPPTTFEDLKLLYPRDSGGIEVATPAIERTLAELKELKAQAKDAEKRRQDLEFQVQSYMGEAATLTDPAGKTFATWKSQTASRLDQARLKAEAPEISQQFTTESTFRVLRIK